MQSSIAFGAGGTTCLQIARGKEDRWYRTQKLNKAHKNENLQLFMDKGYA